jgi:tRNA(Ile)-lysidine synthase
MLPLANFEAFVAQNQLFDREDKILLAISGGRDSVLMAHLFHDAGFRFALAHVNFQLRGEESDEDEAFCRDLALRLEVPFFVTRFDTAVYSDNHQLSIQMAARHLRYTWLEQVCETHQYDYVATAHHQNDSVETVLLNLVRGTGVAGLHGILPKRNKIVRPLLCLTRSEIEHAVATANLPYREDSSNSSIKYARNKLRLEVIPKLKELNPSLEETFAANQRRMAELEELLQLQVETLRKELMPESAEGQMVIALAKLQALHPLRTLLFELFRSYGFSEPVLDDLINSWEGQSGKLFYSASHQILLDRDRLIISTLDNKSISAVQIALGQEEVAWSTERFYITTLAIADFKLAHDASKVQLDADKLSFPLTLRSWEIGDSFQPLGMKGQKKLSDFFVEQKIPLNRKKQIGVLQNSNGDIVCIAGMRIDERYKVSENTKKVFIFEQKPSYV